jgi:hypothetical protein
MEKASHYKCFTSVLIGSKEYTRWMAMNLGTATRHADADLAQIRAAHPSGSAGLRRVDGPAENGKISPLDE